MSIFILGMNGDSSQMGQRTRRGGSKSRLLSPPPGQPPTTNGNSNSNIPDIKVCSFIITVILFTKAVEL